MSSKGNWCSRQDSLNGNKNNFIYWFTSVIPKTIRKNFVDFTIGFPVPQPLTYITIRNIAELISAWVTDPRKQRIPSAVPISNTSRTLARRLQRTLNCWFYSECIFMSYRSHGNSNLDSDFGSNSILEENINLIKSCKRNFALKKEY